MRRRSTPEASRHRRRSPVVPRRPPHWEFRDHRAETRTRETAAEFPRSVGGPICQNYQHLLVALSAPARQRFYINGEAAILAIILRYRTKHIRPWSFKDSSQGADR